MERDRMLLLLYVTVHPRRLLYASPTNEKQVHYRYIQTLEETYFQTRKLVLRGVGTVMVLPHEERMATLDSYNSIGEECQWLK
jgi:hypothetical protein